ncbi:MAG TPA: alpha/beta hydrolase [Microbacterium sp.]|nr:alpha/beta hydrolase [Microbacterium sp.]
MSTDTTATDTFDEFSYLPEQAQELGGAFAVPSGERLHLMLADGRVLSALRYGTGAPVVTFLHGAGLNAHTWDTTIIALGLPALAIDLPGHGDSSWRTDIDYSPRTLAPDVAAGIDAWTDAPQLVVGQSLGGLTAAAVAASRPELVSEVIVVDITPGIDTSAGPSQLRDFFAGPTDWATRDEVVERALAFGLGGSRRATERGVFFNTRVRPDGRVEWKHHFAHLAAAALAPAADVDVTIQAETVPPTLGPAGWEDLAAVAAPVTLIRGDQGYVSEADAEEFARRLPRAGVTTLRAGHNVQEYAPAELGGLIRDAAARTGKHP